MSYDLGELDVETSGVTSATILFGARAGQGGTPEPIDIDPIAAYVATQVRLDDLSGNLSINQLESIPNNRFLGNVSGAALEPAALTAAQVIAGLDLASLYQPLDSDLTAIAALTTTTFGRSLLTLADAAAGRTALGLGSFATISSLAFSSLTGIPTTIAGYGITDAYTKAQVDAAVAAATTPPGGSSGQVQYNNGGAFGGVTGITLNSGVLSALSLSGNISASAWTTAGIRFKNVAGTLTDTSSSGTVATAYTNVWGGNTIAASSVTTFTDYYEAWIKDPIAGSNVTLTNKWSLGLEGRMKAAGVTLSGSDYLIDATATAASSTREQFARFRVSDASNDSLWIGNATSADSGLIPMFAGYQATSNTRSSFQLRAMTSAANDASDSSTFGMLDFAAFRTDNAADPNNGTLTAITNRKVLTVRVDPTSVSILTLMPTGLFTIGSAASVTGSLTLANATAGGATLTSDANNTLALRNGANAQTFNLYNTFTDTLNYERLAIKWASNIVSIQQESTGTGAARTLKIIGPDTSSNLQLTTATCTLSSVGAWNFAVNFGTTVWSMSTSGHFLTGTDNNYDIGASASGRPRIGYFGTGVIVGASGFFQLAGRTYMESVADGNLVFRNNAGSDFGRLQFGGTTSSFPALKRNGTAIDVRLADDSAFASINALQGAFGASSTGYVSGSMIGILSNVGKWVLGTNQDMIVTRFGSAILQHGDVDVNTTTTALSSISNATPAVFTTASAHNMSVATPLKLTTTGALPTGLTVGTQYYVATVPSTTTFTVATSVANALAGTNVATSSAGSGTHSYVVGPIAQWQRMQSAITGTDLVGAPTIFQGSAGTGAGGGGPIVFQVAAAGSTGATQNSYSNSIILGATANATIYMGGTSSSFPALVRGGNAIVVQLADGSDVAGVTAATLISSGGGLASVSIQRGIGVSLGSTNAVQWSSTTAYDGTADTFLYRGASGGILEQRNSTNAQTFNSYFSYTDGSNYQRAALKTAAGNIELAAESAGTGAANIDVKLTPKGTGVVQFGTHSGIASETVTGYITIKDSAGTNRKIAVVS